MGLLRVRNSRGSSSTSSEHVLVLSGLLGTGWWGLGRSASQAAMTTCSMSPYPLIPFCPTMAQTSLNLTFWIIPLPSSFSSCLAWSLILHKATLQSYHRGGRGQIKRGWSYKKKGRGYNRRGAGCRREEAEQRREG